MLTWELLGAVVGAGLASGREIASFFAKYGGWSYVGIVMAVLTMLFLSSGAVPAHWKGRWAGKLWQLLLASLLTATGGAMLSGAAEVAALTLPIRGAYWLGMVATMVLAWYLAHRTAGGLAAVSRILLIVLALLIMLGLMLPPMEAVRLDQTSVHEALLRGMTYGGFNAALQVPIMNAAMKYSPKRRKYAACISAIVMLGLLLLGNAVLQRHPALMAEPMPFIRMMAQYGKLGHFLGAVSLYLAILSTLTACLRGLGRGLLPAAAVAAVALLGFTGVVEVVYPLLGGGCLLMMLAAKFTNSSQKPFISRSDML